MTGIPVIDLTAARQGGLADRRRTALDIDAACREIGFLNHPNDDVLIECIARPGAARHAPVLSGESRDMKYARTGLASAAAS